jgi:EpsI family protein
MLLMFWIGARWRDEPAAPGPVIIDGGDVRTAPSSPSTFGMALLGIMVATLVWPLAEPSAERGDKSPVLLSPVDVAGWTRVTTDSSAFQPKYKDPSATLRETFRRGDAEVMLYIAYYRDQHSRRKLVSSENMLVHSEDLVWRRIDAGTRRVMLGDVKHDAAYSQLRGPREQTLTAFQWYWIDGVVTSSSAVAKALTAWSRLRGRRDDSAVIIVYVEDSDPKPAATKLQAWTKDAWPAISDTLRRAVDGR